MANHNAANARMKREYFDYLKQAQGRDDSSIDQVASAIARFEASTGHKDFKKFHRQQAAAFKVRLGNQKNARTGKTLSRATMLSILKAVRAFFIWLAGQPGYKSRFTYADADYFNLSDKEVRIAKARRHKAFPTLEQVHYVIANMPHKTDIEKRNRALVAFGILSGARDGALASFKLKHVDLEKGRVDQDARDVQTKGSKTFSTWFFPVGDDALRVFEEWCHYLRNDLLRGDEDALFPATQTGLGANGGFQPIGLKRTGWSNAGPIRTIFQKAFEAAGLPYFNPHSFRDTLAQYGERHCPNLEVFKAWSMNLGHSNPATTINSYGTMSPARQAELIRGMKITPSSDPQLDNQTADQLIEALKRKIGK